LLQVSNRADCIKAVGDFLFPNHPEHCLQLTAEFREENLLEGPWMVDVLQVKRTVLHAYMNIQGQCLGLECSDLSSTANSEDHSMAIDDSIFRAVVLDSFITGAISNLQGPGSSTLSDLQDEHTMNIVSKAPHDTLHSDGSSAKVS
jgi:hypothetical protein